jgi:hypothetical protein
MSMKNTTPGKIQVSNIRVRQSENSFQQWYVAQSRMGQNPNKKTSASRTMFAIEYLFSWATGARTVVMKDT